MEKKYYEILRHYVNPNDCAIVIKQLLSLHNVVGQSEQLKCPECENHYPHSHTDGSYSCEDCGHKWVN